MSVPAPLCPKNSFRQESSSRTTTMVRSGVFPGTQTTTSTNNGARWKSRRLCSPGMVPGGGFVPTSYFTSMWNGNATAFPDFEASYENVFGWKWKIKFSGTCSASAGSWGGGSGDPSTDFMTSGRYYSDGGYGSDPIFIASIMNLKGMLNAELLSGLRNQQLNLAESLADVRDTVRMVANTGRYLAQALLAARKGNLSGVKSNLMKALRGRGRQAEIQRIRNGPPPKAADAAGLYLGYTYAWAPLLTDIYNALNFARSRLLNFHRVRVARSQQYTGRPSLYGYIRSWNSRVQIDGHITVVYSLTPAWVTTFKDLGLINPLEVGWAAVPYSFLVDWFVPISQALQNLTATVDLQFHHGYRTIRTEVSESATWFNTEGGCKATDGAFQHSVRGLSVERERLIDFPRTSLYLDGIGINSTRRAANAFALTVAKLAR